MALFSRGQKTANTVSEVGDVTSLLRCASLEVMPRTVAKIGSLQGLIAPKTRVYIAHIEGTPIDDMIDTASQLAKDGFEVMPHFPARLIDDTSMLKEWVARYQGEAGVKEALLLAGGVAQPHGEFSDSMQLLETGVFETAGFTRLHVAGHPEGNKDIDPSGGDEGVMAALRWKQAFQERSDAQMALVTQFAFDMPAMTAWAERIHREGVEIPIHIGLSGPAKLQTLIKFSLACGVGPSLKVLQRRALDLTKLLLPYEPTDLLQSLANYLHENPKSAIENVHFFPLGGIRTNCEWITVQLEQDRA